MHDQGLSVEVDPIPPQVAVASSHPGFDIDSDDDSDRDDSDDEGSYSDSDDVSSDRPTPTHVDDGGPSDDDGNDDGPGNDGGEASLPSALVKTNYILLCLSAVWLI